jgi:hypothetical protein
MSQFYSLVKVYSLFKIDIGKMVSSGLLRRVALVRTDVSEEPGASAVKTSNLT